MQFLIEYFAVGENNKSDRDVEGNLFWKALINACSKCMIIDAGNQLGATLGDFVDQTGISIGVVLPEQRINHWNNMLTINRVENKQLIEDFWHHFECSVDEEVFCSL